jgi:hypothetical protein
LTRDRELGALLHVHRERLHGGISADEVHVVTAAFLDEAGCRRQASWVVKELRGAERREVDVYVRLAEHRAPLAPRLVSTLAGPESTTLVLERVTPAERWPWRDVSRAASVLQLAAGLHEASLGPVAPWDYDLELHAIAASTADLVAAARRDAALPIDGASARAVRRIAADLAEVRRALLSAGPYAPTLIHGDLHPGNVILSREAGTLAPKLVDWGRARMGSPLEDVASWIQSLGCWEPLARLRHDTLLAGYLRARGSCGPIPPEVRAACWLAGACNAMAGALRHHVVTACDRSVTRSRRAGALSAAHDWLRIIRRAAATWREASRHPRGARARRTRARRPPRGPTPVERWTRSPGGTRSSART